MPSDKKYLKLLSSEFPNIAATTTEIINLEAILNLPKATEHFVSDIHGEYEAFQHVLRNGSGNIKEKIREIFYNRLSQKEMNTLATLIYYPKEKIQLILKECETQEEINDWYRVTLSRLIELCVFAASKYTRSKVRKALPQEFAYIIEELLSKDDKFLNKDAYYNEIISSIIALDRGQEFVVAISQLIQRLVVDHLHVLGDIYDRGPYPAKIVDRLMKHHSLDIQWGNHDILWMGAASGSAVCIANVLRISARYDNLEIIEDAYGISLRQLLTFAETTYPERKGSCFEPKLDPDKPPYYEEEARQLAKIQQAIAVIQFKLEAQSIRRNPDFQMEHRMLLDKIDYEKGTITLDGVEYELDNTDFPTIDPKDPYSLTPEEQAVMDRLVYAFTYSEKLQLHVSFLINNGSMYLVYNDNLLYHGCVPLEEDGSFMALELGGKKYAGKALFDMFDEAIRKGFLNRKRQNTTKYLDLIWYLWTGPVSPLFGKGKMTTFERYYIKDKTTHKENKNPYYRLRENEDTVLAILEEFGVSAQNGHIINGHTPVKEKAGEDPIKANGRLLVIDGGYSKAYQETTGLGGYTLLNNSYGMQLVAHQPFSSKKDAIMNESDIISTRRVVDLELERKKVADTDTGKKLCEQIEDLKDLLRAYREGELKEKI
ncbi:fructose-bisphosphatase class III [Atopococcus tabaci]|uniref:fructose-bisphosphatase class III n=1 Tax=Atopococcus tabaci TaxID=269774 RepID=UPI00041D3744|nr:fructose-bisphosphatase class III [Atopococcus tabaci]